MLPAVPSAVTQSDAELRLFRRFKSCPDDWTVLHSLGLRQHDRKPWAEADFVVINSRGVTLVEVKGGSVRREGRTWFTNENELNESPFDQVCGAMAALSNDLRAAVPEVRDGLVMSAVAFPDVEFTEDGPDIVPQLVYDARDREYPIERWLSRCFEYWSEKIDGPRNERRGLSRAVRSKIVDRLAGDFDLRPSLRARLGEVGQELVRLTEQQGQVMAALAVNPRIVVTGGAGTGKTWLALEEALRLSAADARVLLMCHTKALAAWLRERMKAHDLVDVVHYNGLTTQLIRQAGLQAKLSGEEGDRRFLVEHPELALEALYCIDDPPAYDAVLVDEAQDFLNVPAVEFIDGLLGKNLTGGTWRLFLDPRQDVLAGLDRAAMERLAEYAPTRFPLTINCRNTAEIATQTAVMAARGLEESLPVSGPDVRYFYFADDKEQRREIGAILREWLNSGVQPQDIVILGTRTMGFSAISDGLPRGVGAQVVETTRTDGRRTIRYSTIATFKGLEADAVLMLDVGALPAERKASMDIYVGMSRARAILAVGVYARYRPEHEQLYAALGARMGSVKVAG
jgi:hypothetical protein